ncbi:MAG: T9SS type A sorting domain-containing protein [Bacteroidetes bacterium]|nr:T9SS type A sorting domain-containing protein [Bacteroidota bacterium]
MNRYIILLIFCVFQVSAGFAQDTISLMSYNLLAYYTDALDSTTRNPYYRVITNNYQPDIIVTQEIKSQSGAAGFLNNVLKPVNPDYQIGPYFQGPDTNRSIYFKSSKFNCIDNLIINTGLRDINHFILIHKESGDTLHVFSLHLKASSGVTNEAQRKSEIDSLRKVTDNFSSTDAYIVAGDFNIYSANEPAYIRLKEENTNGTGHFVDPLTLTGSWNNPAYAIHHTQSPRVRSFGGGVTGGLDDRFDMILFSPSIQSSGKVRYVPNSTVAVGNDGMHYNDSINRLPNTAVSNTMAAALHYASDHLPVMAKFVFVNGWPSGISSVKQKLNLYPQPASQVLFIEGATIYEASYTVTDISGRIVQHGQFENNPLSVRDLQNGLYLLTLRSALQTYTQSFMVIH